MMEKVSPRARTRCDHAITRWPYLSLETSLRFADMGSALEVVLQNLGRKS